jgi:hypothetical protein
MGPTPCEWVLYNNHSPVVNLTPTTFFVFLVTSSPTVTLYQRATVHHQPKNSPSMPSWDCSDSGGSAGSPYGLLFNALALIPLWHYLLGSLIVAVVVLYNFLEIHFLEDLFSGFRGSTVGLTHHPSSHLYDGVVSKCRVLHGRYEDITNSLGKSSFGCGETEEIKNGVFFSSFSSGTKRV